MPFTFDAAEFDRCENCKRVIRPGQRVVFESPDAALVHETCPEVQ